MRILLLAAALLVVGCAENPYQDQAAGPATAAAGPVSGSAKAGPSAITSPAGSKASTSAPMPVSTTGSPSLTTPTSTSASPLQDVVDKLRADLDTSIKAAQAQSASADPGIAKLAADRALCYQTVETYLPPPLPLGSVVGPISLQERILEIAAWLEGSGGSIPMLVRANCASYAGQVGATVNAVVGRIVAPVMVAAKAL